MQQIIDAYQAAITGYIPCFLALVCLLWFLERRLSPRAWKFTLGSVLLTVGIFFLLYALSQGRMTGILTSALLIVVGVRSLGTGMRMTAEIEEDKGKMEAKGSE